MRFPLKVLITVFSLLATSAFGQSLSIDDSPAETAPGLDSVIQVQPDQLVDDEQIESRLADIFSHVPDLAAVSVSVEGGVVVLDGLVDDSDIRDRAEELAWRVNGVAVVVNRIERERALKNRIAAASHALLEQARGLVAMTPVLLLALFVMGISVLLARFVGRADWIYSRITRNWFLRDLWRQVFQLAVIAIGLLFALKLLDATALVGSLLGALGIIGLAIGFATRDTVENYIASILLSIRQPFRREDHVMVNDIEGKVVRLTPRATVLMSPAGNHIRIPNSSVFKATIVNFTRNPLRRLTFTVGVDTDLDLTHPRKLAIETLGKIPGILDDPEPVCLVDALGDSNVVLKIQAWIDQRESDYHKARSEAQRLIKDAFDEAGIVMPEPIYNVNLRRTRLVEKTVSSKSPPRPAEHKADTAVDNSVEVQIREEGRIHTEEDLLDEQAPVE